MDEPEFRQSISAGDRSILVQAGRDVILPLTKALPNIRLVRVTVEDDHGDAGLRQKVNMILKNNGETSAFLLNGFVISDRHAVIQDCNQIGMHYNLSTADWEYDVDIDDGEASFVGRHAIAPNEVVNFDILVGRGQGSHELSVYRTRIRLMFDEGGVIETDPFFLRIAGPTVWQAGYMPQGPSPEEWGRCMADNIRRLDSIGYDFRPHIDPASQKYIEAVAPGLVSQPPS